MTTRRRQKSSEKFQTRNRSIDVNLGRFQNVKNHAEKRKNSTKTKYSTKIKNSNCLIKWRHKSIKIKTFEEDPNDDFRNWESADLHLNEEESDYLIMKNEEGSTQKIHLRSTTLRVKIQLNILSLLDHGDSAKQWKIRTYRSWKLKKRESKAMNKSKKRKLMLLKNLEKAISMVRKQEVSKLV